MNLHLRIGFLAFLLFVIGVPSFAQIGIRSGSTEVAKPEVTMVQYDTTSLYLNPKKLVSEPHYYDGQRIMFLPAHFKGDRAFNYILGFSVPNEFPQYEYADTVWLKKRKKVRPEDYRIDVPITNVYKPIRPNSACYGKEYGVNFYMENFGLNGAISRNSFVTPASEIEGKTFTIQSAEVKANPQSSYRTFVLHMINEEWEDVYFSFTHHPNAYQDFPILMLAYTERIQNDYVGKSFVAVSDVLYRRYAARSANGNELCALKGDIKVNELSLFDAGEFKAKTTGTTTYGTSSPAAFEEYTYLTPFLFIVDETGTEYRVGLQNKKSSSYTMSNSVKNAEDGKVYMELALENLTDAEEYYAQLRAAEEKKRLEQEALEQARAERYKALKNKYGKGNADLMMEGKVRIGWSKQMCIEGWGEPESINRSSGSWGVHEQWVYGGGNYLYFENGKLTSIQN